MSTAPLAIEYPNTLDILCFAAIDDILIIDPYPCSTINSLKITVGVTVPNKFISTTFCVSPVAMSRIVWSGFNVAPGMLPPARLTSPSKCLNSFLI